MTQTGTHIKGHARTVVAVGVEQRGPIRRVARGYVARCACGWESPEAQVKEYANTLHAAHKAER